VTHRVALIGGRGYAGSEFLNLLAGHPRLELAVASSSSRAGASLGEVAAAWRGRPETFEALGPDGVTGIDAEVWVLALPNGMSGGWVEKIEEAHPGARILDLSADHRFDGGWSYGLPELNRRALAGARRIANPGCYATGAQLGLAPLVDALSGVPVVFGVSGYSGAGRSPSPRNDPERLHENLIPYSLTGHTHEREIGRHLRREVRFHPHVAGFFRGISLTISVELAEPVDPRALAERFEDRYRGEACIGIRSEPPEIREVRGTPATLIGGFAADGRKPQRMSLVVALDNLLKGAASQALQNLNLALGMDESLGVVP
jgi:N-acetyl-gamma-glutamyl-phosphate reductase